MRISLAFVLIAAACGTELPSPGTSGGGAPDAGMGGIDPGFQALVMQDWTLQPSEQNYLCVRLTIQQDIWIKQIQPVSPRGTHHSVLMSGPPSGQDGVVDCSSALTEPAIYASGVGTQPLTMPDGVAIHLKQGDQLLLNLHLFNTDPDNPLTGTSGIEFVPADPVDAAHEAGVTLAGLAQGLTVPPLGSTQTGTCTTPAGHTMFAVAPHMHLLGTHMNVTYNGATVMDRDYSFDDQTFQEITPPIVTANAGKYVVNCTYFNATGATVYFGESTTDEMCFAMTFMYPPPPKDECVN